MFKNNTVFILGAGASWHYGYPTGEELVQKVIEKAKEALSYFKSSINIDNPYIPEYVQRICTNIYQPLVRDRWRQAYNETEALIERLKNINPLVIDYFLGHNPTLQPIGKLMIAWVILECEASYKKEGNINRTDKIREQHKDDWYRFITHKLTAGCRESNYLPENRVKFITFNYDISLEEYLYTRLSTIERFEKNDIGAFWQSNRILHIYGKVRNYPTGYSPISLNAFTHEYRGLVSQHYGQSVEYLNKTKQLFDTIYEASKELQTIDPHEKSNNSQVIQAAREAIYEADCVYILGYGFDENNSRILDLYKGLRLSKRNRKMIMFTNLNDSNRINKKASKVFFGRFDQLLSTKPATKGSPNGAYFCEKSIRDVYGAFEHDFDSMEEEELRYTQEDEEV